MSAMEEFLNARNARRAADADASRLGRVAFEEGMIKIFAEHPVLKGFRWTQYTPYFNDGDTCSFSAHTDYFDYQLVPRSERELDRDESTTDGADDDDWFEDASSHSRQYAYENGTSRLREPWELTDIDRALVAVSTLLNSFDEDDYLHMFDDHSEITCTRYQGIQVDDCEHD